MRLVPNIGSHAQTEHICNQTLVYATYFNHWAFPHEVTISENTRNEKCFSCPLNISTRVWLCRRIQCVWLITGWSLWAADRHLSYFSDWLIMTVCELTGEFIAWTSFLSKRGFVGSNPEPPLSTWVGTVLEGYLSFLTVIDTAWSFPPTVFTKETSRHGRSEITAVLGLHSACVLFS